MVRQPVGVMQYTWRTHDAMCLGIEAMHLERFWWCLGDLKPDRDVGMVDTWSLVSAMKDRSSSTTEEQPSTPVMKAFKLFLFFPVWEQIWKNHLRRKSSLEEVRWNYPTLETSEMLDLVGSRKIGPAWQMSLFVMIKFEILILTCSVVVKDLRNNKSTVQCNCKRFKKQ
ncbi:unnamed protein product [Amoebophrya sp. A25]|nr:unnamed protein product [Amoebophrya sp. A25]|eukprot:GSA25T00012546001.1